MSTLQEARGLLNELIHGVQLTEYNPAYYIPLLEAILDAARDAETVAQRTVSEVVGFLNERIDEAAAHIKTAPAKGAVYEIASAALQSARDGLVASYDLNRALRSLAATERVCVWAHDVNVPPVGRPWKTKCVDGQSRSYSYTYGEFCPGCGARIEIKE